MSKLAGTVRPPPPQQVQGTDPRFSASVGRNGTSVLDILQTISNTGVTDTFTDLRFMPGVQPDGGGALGASAMFLDNVSEFREATAPGDADARQVQSLPADPGNALVGSMASDNGVTDGASACPVACDADVGLHWSRASLAPGETGSTGIGLVDDPAPGGGRCHLVATFANAAGKQFFVGNAQFVPGAGIQARLIAGRTVVAVRGIRAGRRLSIAP